MVQIAVYIRGDKGQFYSTAVAKKMPRKRTFEAFLMGGTNLRRGARPNRRELKPDYLSLPRIRL